MDEIRSGHGHEHDPQRRWLRHTYQEGPGFRFLATRGGRPPRGSVEPRDLALVRLRARCIRVAREEGVTAALALGASSRASLFRWQAAYAAGGLAALLPERRGPRNAAAVHPAWLELVVITVRLHTYWNSKRIAAELRRREIATVSEFWIEALFDRLGTARPSRPYLPSAVRYERHRSNELWHIDIKGPFFIQLGAGRDGSALRVLATPNLEDNRYPQLWDLDLRVAKDIKIKGTARFNVAADLFNVINANTELGRVRRLNSSTFGQLNDILSPRILRLTFGVKF